MRPAAWAMMLVLMLVGGTQAQDARQPSDWKKMYQDVEGQLHAAQDRKAEMAREAAELTARNAQLQKQLQAAQDQVQVLKRQVDSLTYQTLFMGDVYADWETFTVLRPAVLEQWRSFWGDSLPDIFDGFPLVFDPRWPFSAQQ